MPEYQIQHQPEKTQFVIELSNGKRAYVKYNCTGASEDTAMIDFFTTFVPDTHRSKGLAALLVDHAFDWAEGQKLQISNSCGYSAKKYARRQRSNLTVE